MRDLLGDLNIPHELDVPLGPYTWYGLGGPAQVLARPASVQQLSALAARCSTKKVPMYVLGSGANLLVADQGVPGVVVRLDDANFCQVTFDGNRVSAGAGYDLMKLVLESARRGLGGLECLAGIPATVGGAVRMNAGGTFGDIGPAVDRVQVMDDGGQVYYRGRDDLVFSYRKSNIIARFILSVEFELSRQDPDELIRQVKEVFLYKKSSQPMAAHSPGCAYKNPDQAPAGRLIDDAGLKGYRVGGAYVSQRHANFILAGPGASAADVLAVLEHIEQTVRARFGIDLEREIVVWP